MHPFELSPVITFESIRRAAVPVSTERWIQAPHARRLALKRDEARTEQRPEDETQVDRQHGEEDPAVTAVLGRKLRQVERG
jgi:hypothetical protein